MRREQCKQSLYAHYAKLHAPNNIVYAMEHGNSILIIVAYRVPLRTSLTTAYAIHRLTLPRFLQCTGPLLNDRRSTGVILPLAYYRLTLTLLRSLGTYRTKVLRCTLRIVSVLNAGYISNVYTWRYIRTMRRKDYYPKRERLRFPYVYPTKFRAFTPVSIHYRAYMWLTLHRSKLE